jgi:uncharacterized protein YdhG (YjbR/CyaY superfamily)
MASSPRKTSPPKTVAEYIRTFPPDVQKVLRAVRGALREGAPGGEDKVSYGMADYRIDGRVVLYYGAWKRHYALYPLIDSLKAKFGARLKGHTSDKGTMKFAYAQPVPTRLIAAMAKHRAAEIRREAAAKARARAAKKATKSKTTTRRT